MGRKSLSGYLRFEVTRPKSGFWNDVSRPSVCRMYSALYPKARDFFLIGRKGEADIKKTIQNYYFLKIVSIDVHEILLKGQNKTYCLDRELSVINKNKTTNGIVIKYVICQNRLQ